MTPSAFILILTMLSGDVGPWPTHVSEAFCQRVVFEVKLFGKLPVERQLPGGQPFLDYVIGAECRPAETASS